MITLLLPTRGWKFPPQQAEQVFFASTGIADTPRELSSKATESSFLPSPFCWLNVDRMVAAKTKVLHQGKSHMLRKAKHQDRRSGGPQWLHGYLFELLECEVFCSLHLKLIRPLHYSKVIFVAVKFYLCTVSFVDSRSFPLKALTHQFQGYKRETEILSDKHLCDCLKHKPQLMLDKQFFMTFIFPLSVTCPQSEQVTWKSCDELHPCTSWFNLLFKLSRW